jgi:hypothetical protein
MVNEKGPRHLPVEGRGNVEVKRAAGPLPFQPPGEASAPVKTLYFLRCCVEGCNWSTWSTDKRSGLGHRNRSQHSHLQSHLFEPIPPEEVKEKRRAANRRYQQEHQARKRAAKEVGSQILEVRSMFPVIAHRHHRRGHAHITHSLRAVIYQIHGVGYNVLIAACCFPALAVERFE